MEPVCGRRTWLKAAPRTRSGLQRHRLAEEHNFGARPRPSSALYRSFAASAAHLLTFVPSDTSGRTGEGD